MRQSSRYIILAGAAVSGISSFYFLSLFFSVPVYVPLVLSVLFLAVLFKWLFIDNKKQPELISNKKGWVSIAVLILVLFAIMAQAPFYSTKYGGWDAWVIWNFHAEYLADPAHWRTLFQNTEYAHPDYPACQPTFIAFFMRLLSADSPVVIPYVFCFAVTLSIPALIFQEVAGKNLFVATIATALFAAEVYYISAGISQYADILVAFFFLCAFVCMAYRSASKVFIGLAAFFLASCACAKNEGILLSIIFMSFYVTVFFARKNIKYTVSGLLLPLISLIALKLFCPVSNDLVSKSNAGMLGYLFQAGRYTPVFNSYMAMIQEKFFWASVAICVYIGVSVILKKLPGRNMYILLTCLFAYSMIYVITPMPQEWHLSTSHSRLILQLMPAVVYVMANDIADRPLSLPGWLKLRKGQR